jgi:hypothetical protein
MYPRGKSPSPKEEVVGLLVRPESRVIPPPAEDDSSKFELVRQVAIGNPPWDFDRVILFCWDTLPATFYVRVFLHYSLLNLAFTCSLCQGNEI